MRIFNQYNLKAAAIHLGISAGIAIVSMVVVFGVWYPTPLDSALGVSTIFLMLLTIDIILGPLMTLVVYKPNKSSLKFDLSVIACVQLAALLYGLHTVGSARPAYLVFTNDRFDLVQAHEVARIAGAPAKPELAMQSPWAQPLWGYKTMAANIPTDADYIPLLNALTTSAMSGGPDVPNVQDLHAPYTQAVPRILAKALPLNTLKTSNPATTEQVRMLQNKYPKNSIVTPLKIKFTIYTVVMNPLDASILGIEPIDVF